MLPPMCEPAWLGEWEQTAERVSLTDELLASMRASAKARRDVRDALVAFPPGCLVQVVGDVFISVRLLERAEGVYVGFIDCPSGQMMRYRRPADLKVIRYLDIYTPALMASLLDDVPLN